MSEELTQPPPIDRLLENAKRISQYMREQLEELKGILDREPPTEKVEDMLRAAGDRIDDAPNLSEGRQITDGERLGELWGLPIIARVPQLCAHCLEMKVCTIVPFQRTRRAYYVDEPDRVGPRFDQIPLCRECKRDAHNARGLVLEE